MNTFIPKAFLFTSWTLMSGWLLSDGSFFFESQEKQLQLLICFFLLFLGSFIFFRQPINETNITYLYLILSLVFSIFLDQINNPVFLTLRFLCFAFIPLLLFSFLQSFLADNRPKRIKLLLILITCLTFVAFALSFHPNFSLLALYLCTFVFAIFYLKEKNWLFPSKSRRLLNFSVIGLLFCSFLLSSNTFSFFSIIGGQSLILIELLIVFFTSSLAYLLIKEYYLNFSTRWIEAAIILFISFSVALGMRFFQNSFLLHFFQILVGTASSLFFIQKWEQQQKKKQQQAQKEFLFEKKELLNQLTYNQFLQEVAKLLTFSIEEQSKSPRFLVLLKSGNDYLSLSQKGTSLKNIALSKIPDLLAKQGAFFHDGLAYEWFHLEIQSENIWLFFEQTDQTISHSMIRSLIEKYLKFIQMVRFLHLAQKPTFEIPLDTNVQLQAKLFNSLETQKKKQADYLHDDVLQTIIALKTLTTRLKGDAAIKNLVEDSFSQLIASIRQEIFHIAPSTLYHIPLTDNITILMQDFSRRYPETNFTFTWDSRHDVPSRLVAPVYRIIKELNENIGKHAQATQALTKLTIHDAILTLFIQDNGLGIPAIENFEQILLQNQTHIGLLSIKNDIKWLNGTFTLLPPTDLFSGVNIKITIPLMDRKEENDEDFAN